MKLLTFILKYPSFCITLVLMSLLILQREVLNKSTDKKVQTAINNLIQAAPVTIHDSTHTDTVYFTQTLLRPYAVYRDTCSVHWEEAPADTVAILKDYLSRNVYRRTIVDDTNAKIILTDTVTHNLLLGGAVQASFYPRTRTITREHYIASTPSGKLYVGITLGLNPQKLNFVPALFFNTRSNHLYGLGYDLINRTPQVSVFFKL